MRRDAVNVQLLLSSIRSVLSRLEETIIFALIERAQFATNAIVYRPDAVAHATGGESLVGFLLRETERTHAKMRRYTSPDEHPFYTGLPDPILPPLNYYENPLAPNTINLNPLIRAVYEHEIVPYICQDGDDGQYGSSAVCDVNCLQSLSKRIHYGKFVAESKFQAAPASFKPLIAAGDSAALAQLITVAAVETHVLGRVRRKARTYGRDAGSAATPSRFDEERVVDVYERWIIPLTKRVEVEYLLGRGEAQ